MRGWVTEVAVEPEIPRAQVRPLAKWSSTGPPADVLALTEWAAWRWVGPRATFLRAASPANNVITGERGRLAATDHERQAPPVAPDVEAIAGDARSRETAVVRWPPAARMAGLLRRLLAPRGSTIVLMPDAARAEAFAGLLRAGGVRVITMHGHDASAVRTRAWIEAREGECVVVGGRIAAWAPVPDLEAAVVVDDGDEAMKEERAPTWNGRDVTLERCRRAGARFTVVSAVPTLEAIEACDHAIRLATNRERSGWRRVLVLDRREEPPGAGMFSPPLIEDLRRADGRVICVLNRKGRSRLLACATCGAVARCERCGAAVREDTASEATRRLTCGACGLSRPQVCAECASTRLARLRPGISRLRDELSALLPRREVAEVDAGSGGVPEAPALIGTEAVLHRVREAEVVAFLDIDQEFLAPRFRAAEQALWLLARGVRLTRARGRVIVQTRSPDHDVLRAAATGALDVFVEGERARRLALRFPPFGALAHVEGDERAVGTTCALVSEREGIEVLGPAPVRAGITAALVRAEDAGALSDALAPAAGVARAEGRLRIDVDPLRV